MTGFYQEKMKTRLTLKPGQNETKKLAREFGDRLLFVRYRYDEKRNKRFKTVEFIVEESDWISSKSNIPKDMIVGVQIGYDEKELQETVRRIGGIWDRTQKFWMLRYEEAVANGLKDRLGAHNVQRLTVFY